MISHEATVHVILDLHPWRLALGMRCHRVTSSELLAELDMRDYQADLSLLEINDLIRSSFTYPLQLTSAGADLPALLLQGELVEKAPSPSGLHIRFKLLRADRDLEEWIAAQ